MRVAVVVVMCDKDGRGGRRSENAQTVAVFRQKFAGLALNVKLAVAVEHARDADVEQLALLEFFDRRFFVSRIRKVSGVLAINTVDSTLNGLIRIFAPSVQLMPIDASFDFTLNFMPGKASFSALRMIFAVSAVLMYFVISRLDAVGFQNLILRFGCRIVLLLDAVFVF